MQCWEKKKGSGWKKHSFTGAKSCVAVKPWRDISNLFFSDSVQKLYFFENISTKCLLYITFYHFNGFRSKVLSKQKCFCKEIKLSQVFFNIFPQPPLKFKNRLWNSKESDWLRFFCHCICNWRFKKYGCIWFLIKIKSSCKSFLLNFFRF